MNILVIRLRLIGDVVFTTPALRALRRAFPGARLTYLVEREAAPVVRGNPHLDEVIVVPRTRGIRRLIDDVRLAQRLRTAKFDVVIDMHGGPRSAWLAWATGAPERIGYGMPGRHWMYTRGVSRPRELRPRHSVANQWDLLAAVPGWPGDEPDPRRDPVEMPLEAAAVATIDARLRVAGVDSADEIVVVHVSAGNPFRRWPEASFVRLIAELASARPGCRLILTSGPSDHAAADRIARAARAELGAAAAARVLEFGDFDLAELRALVGRSTLFVGGDSGPLHIAATTTTPIVALFGPTLPERSLPWRSPAIPTETVAVERLACRPCEQRVCVHGDYRCLTTLAPAQVIAAAERAAGAMR
ncbi:MAG TPA: glycosyltransferase family 9 protein [Vicinamibacterales bacterium]|nr:glycosyltransferase family 9 protein [Vicinamibacterales bacterium]